MAGENGTNAQLKLLESEKRDRYLSWEDYFMSIAILSAQRSKDPVTQVGACIKDSNNKIVGIGYNGMPNGCDDNEMPWGKPRNNLLLNKHLYVCHAEMNAIMNCNGTERNAMQQCELYTVLFPCNECAKLIIQSGLKNVCYKDDKDGDKTTAAKILFDKAGVKYRKYVSNLVKKVVIDLEMPKNSRIISADGDSAA